MTRIVPSWPDPPKISDNPEKQKRFEEWVADSNTHHLLQLEALVAEINRLQAVVDSLSKSQ